MSLEPADRPESYRDVFMLPGAPTRRSESQYPCAVCAAVRWFVFEAPGVIRAQTSSVGEDVTFVNTGCVV